MLDSSANLASQTNYTYTSSASATTGVVQHGIQNAGGPYLQSVSSWLNTNPAHPPTVTSTMDDTGTVVGVSDANNNPSISVHLSMR